MVFMASFLIKFDDVNLTFDVSPIFKVDFLRNYCSYLLYICIDERMTAPLSENEIKFKNIQKMRE